MHFGGFSQRSFFFLSTWGVMSLGHVVSSALDLCVLNVTLYSFLYAVSFPTQFVFSNYNGSVWNHCRPIVMQLLHV